MGCTALLKKTPGPANPMVTYGGASTNDVNLVAGLKTLQTLNAAANPTPTEQPINAAIGALITLASAAAGYMARHAVGSTNKELLTAIASLRPPPPA